MTGISAPVTPATAAATNEPKSHLWRRLQQAQCRSSIDRLLTASGVFRVNRVRSRTSASA